MSQYIRLMLYLLLSSNLNLNCSILINGDINSSTQTTSFNIGPSAFDRNGGVLQKPTIYIGAKQAVANNNYAIARVNTDTNKLQPLAPSQITLNRTASEANPLYGAQINFLKLNNDLPVVLINGDSNIYKYGSVLGGLSLLSVPVKDGNGNNTSNFFGLEAANGAQGQGFVACAPNSSNFGSTGSGIALFKNVTSGQTTNYVMQNNSMAVALDNSSSSIKINNNVVLQNSCDIYWSGELGCLFLGLQATSNAAGGSGARSVVVGKITPVSGQDYDTISFEPIVPDSAVSGNNQIIANLVANTTTSAIKVRELITSTRLHYLIVLGGNNSASNVGNKVYALPLVNAAGDNLGHLAAYNQTPTDIYNSSNILIGRTLETAATSSSDLLTTSDEQAIVGGGNLPLLASESVTNLFISGDCVYAAIGTSANSNAAGIWKSQAIFNQNGLIESWTAWEKVSGFSGPVFGMGINNQDATYWYLTGSDINSVNTIKKTVWSDGAKDGLLGGTTTNPNVGLVNILSELFPSNNGGVFNLVNFTSNNPALNGISLLIATGYQSLAIINPSASTAGDYASGLVESTNDAYPSASSSSTIASITGPNLSTISAINNAHLATNQDLGMSWLIVSGSQGVAILRTSDGSGWTTPLTSLAGLDSSYGFEIFGNYQFVKKIASDDRYLYILTQTQLDRIEMTSENLSAANPVVETVCQIGLLPSSTSNDIFNDVVLVERLAIVASSAGLYRVANGSDIQNPVVEWVLVTVPEQIVKPCTKLVSINPTPGTDLTLNEAGNLYVINSYNGLHQTTINRFYIKLTGEINDNTILPLPDLYIANELSYFINFESFRNNFFTDGTFLINSLSQDANLSSYAQIMQPNIESGDTTAQTRNSYNINLPAITQSNAITSILRDSNGGALIISGEFGIRINE